MNDTITKYLHHLYNCAAYADKPAVNCDCGYYEASAEIKRLRRIEAAATFIANNKQNFRFFDPVERMAFEDLVDAVESK